MLFLDGEHPLSCAHCYRNIAMGTCTGFFFFFFWIKFIVLEGHSLCYTSLSEGM